MTVGLEERKIAAISYVPLLSIVCLWGRSEHFIRFHARQALVLHILFFVFILLPWWLTGILEIIVFWGIILGFYQASVGKEYELPLIRELLKHKKKPKL